MHSWIDATCRQQPHTVVHYSVWSLSICKVLQQEQAIACAKSSAWVRTNGLFDLLLWPQLVCVSTLLLAAVGCTGVQPGIAPANDEPTWSHVNSFTLHKWQLLWQCNGPSSEPPCNASSPTIRRQITWLLLWAVYIMKWSDDCSIQYGLKLGLSWQQEAKWWGMLAVRWIIRLSTMSRRYWETNFTTWLCATPLNMQDRGPHDECWGTLQHMWGYDTWI